MTEDKLVLLAKVPDGGLAHVIKTLVKSHDIECVVFDDHPSGVGLGVQDVRVMVLESDLEKAQSIVRENNFEGLC